MQQPVLMLPVLLLNVRLPCGLPVLAIQFSPVQEVEEPAGQFSCPAGYTSPSGFGAISYTGVAVQPRNGQLVARFTF